MDDRLSLLKQWLSDVLAVREYELRPASSDASFRRYFRIALSGQTFIAMDAPPDRESVARYADVARRMLALGLNVPEILETNPQQGFLLTSDLGSRLYLDALDAQSADSLYADAFEALTVLQRGTPSDATLLPPYDASLLRRELELFREWYLGRHLGCRLSASQDRVLEAAFDLLVRSALEQPQVWVHRDYHSRNLMVTANRNPGILDFQDAVRGPITYDAVSLLRDCYIAWPTGDVDRWMDQYLRLARSVGLPVGYNDERFRCWFDFMGVQRHLKAAGIFARLLHRDGKPGYLGDIPRTLGYVADVCRRYPELVSLGGLLADLQRPGAES